MFCMRYDTWRSICDMYLNLGVGTHKSYLQWYPFAIMTKGDKEYLKSEDFYNKYIKTFSFIFFESSMQCSNNYLQKGDGSFRDATLISPLLYLVLQAYGKEIYEKYVPSRSKDISVFYAGNYQHMRAKYKKDYDDFFKEINCCLEKYQYFIKTDISSFYSNINVDRLIYRIDNICNSEDISFTSTQLNLFKELLMYCGNGHFPLIENSLASSYLATVVYLDEVDEKLYKYVSENIQIFKDFKMIRYVDDLYILISSETTIKELHGAYNEIKNEYSSILKSFGLSLNTNKCCIKETQKISGELKKSLYNEVYCAKNHFIEELYKGSFKKFINGLTNELAQDSIDVSAYNNLIEKHFCDNNIEFTASEVFNYFIYTDNNELYSPETENEIIKLVENGISYISLDPRRLTVMVLKTRNERAIKSLLCQLFSTSRDKRWNSYHTSIAISYLLHRGFKQGDLLEILKHQDAELYDYYKVNCKVSCMKVFDDKKINNLLECIYFDVKASYLYFMYCCEMRRYNYMAAFAFYKNFFDRTTADIEFKEKQLKKPSYNGAYRKGDLKKFYANIKYSDEIIETAHKLRNANPISHSSSELLDEVNTSEQLIKNMYDLRYLVFEYIK